MINKEYWDKFYNENKVIDKESSFAVYVLNYIRHNNIEGNLIDIACGNGRDSNFFSLNNIETTGLDISTNLLDTKFNFIKNNLFEEDYSKYKIFYLRFCIHTLTENELDKLIKILHKINDIYIFIETRSSRGITNEDKSETFFKSSIGEEHFRMLYSKEYLSNKLSIFKILETSEGKYSKFGTDDPYCIRYILRN